MASSALPPHGVLLILLTLASTANSQSFWGYPRHSYGGGAPSFGYPRGFDRRTGAYGRQSDLLDDYYGYQRCPPYEDIQTSRWRQLEDGSAFMQISLPGVHASNRRFFVADDGQGLEVKAARALPSSRGRACLPRGAEVSADGRHEILRRTLPVPEGFEAEEVKLQSKGSSIVEIRVPPKQRLPQGAAPEKPRHQVATPAGVGSASAGRHHRRAPTVPQSPVPLPSKPANLPPADGIEVLDDDYPEEPIKDADACEGYYDNRGEFHYY